TVVIEDVPAHTTVVGNPGHPVRVEGRRVEGPDTDWIHLPDPIADAIKELSDRIAVLERHLARLNGEEDPGTAEGTELRPKKGARRAGRSPGAPRLGRAYACPMAPGREEVKLAADEPPAGAPIEAGADQVERLLAVLNGSQREAVTFGEGPLLILAGAGSGKDRALAHRIAWLLATGRAHPNQILAITFTNKAAEEMRERVASLVGGVSRRMWVMTFHAACARLLRIEAERLGYTSRFTIYDEADSLRM